MGASWLSPASAEGNPVANCWLATAVEADEVGAARLETDAGAKAGLASCDGDAETVLTERASASLTTSRRVCSAPSSSGWKAGRLGTRSCNADRISTRLIESIPRS